VYLFQHLELLVKLYAYFYPKYFIDEII